MGEGEVRPLPVVLGESTACVESIDRQKEDWCSEGRSELEKKEKKKKRKEKEEWRRRCRRHERTNEGEENRFHKHTYASIFDDRPSAPRKKKRKRRRRRMDDRWFSFSSIALIEQKQHRTRQDVCTSRTRNNDLERRWWWCSRVYSFARSLSLIESNIIDINISLSWEDASQPAAEGKRKRRKKQNWDNIDIKSNWMAKTKIKQIEDRRIEHVYLDSCDKTKLQGKTKESYVNKLKSTQADWKRWSSPLKWMNASFPFRVLDVDQIGVGEKRQIDVLSSAYPRSDSRSDHFSDKKKTSKMIFLCRNQCVSCEHESKNGD